MKLNKKQKKALFDRIRAVQELLLLTHWTIKVEFSDEDTDAIAEINCLPTYLTAIIRFFEPFFEQDEREQGDTILHEVCHILLTKTIHHAFDLKKGKRVSRKHLTGDHESTTEHVKNVIVNLLHK